MTDHTLAQPHSDLDDQALDWFVRFSAAPEQLRADAGFQAWLAAHPDNGAAFARWQADWRQLDALPADGIAQLRQQLARDKAVASRAATAAPARRWWQGGAAAWPQTALAAVLVCATGGGGYLAWDDWQQQPVFAQSFATQRGQQLNVQLPDGSEMRLDTATQVQVTLYRQRREVRLPEGQAVFHVQADSARPFAVLAGNTQVTVVGTRFSVRNTLGQPVLVAVEEGRVQVAPAASAPHPEPTVLLAAGEQTSADADGQIQPAAPLAASGIAPWQEGRVSFDNLPLGQALAELERYGPTGLVLRDPAVAALRLTGSFMPNNSAYFRKALPKVLPVQLQSHGEQTEIVAKP